MMMARFSEAFLVLKASESGLSTAYVPLVMVVMSVVYSLASYPAGILSDRIGRRGLLVAGLLVLIVADLVLAFAGSISIDAHRRRAVGPPHGPHAGRCYPPWWRMRRAIVSAAPPSACSTSQRGWRCLQAA